MSEVAAHLVDRVLPAVPVRQWVLSLPLPLRFTLARDHALLTVVIAVTMRAILGFQRERAKRILGVAGRCGAVTVVQRFGGALNLNGHFHAIVLDGVHVRRIEGSLPFHVLAEMWHAERLALTDTIARRVRRLLARRGLLADDAGPPNDETPSALDAWQAASVRNVVAFGPRAGRPLRKIVLPLPVSSAADRDRVDRLDRPANGRRDAQQFERDVGSVIAATDRSRLERPCRSTLRPPLAMDRLEELPDRRLKSAFRHPWRDGTSAIIMEPLDFLARLAALVPAPRRHLVRYFGTLAPNARVRSRIVPVVARVKSADAASAPESPRAATRRSARLTWAELMLRVFKIDVLECPRCQARLKIIATVTTPSAVKAILECHVLPARPPPLAAVREREQGELGFDG